MNGAPLLLLVSLLQQTPKTQVDASAAAPEEEGVHFHAAIEAGGLALPSGTGANGMDMFGFVFPRIGV
ncbi:MAG TPA: hypothetical protein VF697_10525, partial [Archangium sp.]